METTEANEEQRGRLDLSRLAEPFPVEDIEWRVSRAGMGSKGIYCNVLAYITARAIQNRLDDVCGPEKWQLQPPKSMEIKPGVYAISCGISIRINGEWVTKYDVSEPTNIEAAKGGFSGAMKRAGAQWGVGRYLYHLTEAFAEVSETRSKGWNYAKLKDNGTVYYWKPPQLPAWAVPKEKEHEVSVGQLKALKAAWREKFGKELTSPKDIHEGFSLFVKSVVGEFPVSDFKCWTTDILDRCSKRIEETTDPGGISADVKFD